MLKGFDRLIEARIREAGERGDFDGLPGAGRPLPPEDWTGVSPEARLAVRILKASGCMPAELESLAALGREVRAPDGPSRARRVLALKLALEARGLGATAAAILAGATNDAAAASSPRTSARRDPDETGRASPPRS